MKSDWEIGKDFFAKWIGDDDHFDSNIGPGKYLPMRPSCIVDGKEILWYCEYSPNGLTASSILYQILEKLDGEGVVKGSINNNGSEYYMALIIDSHISWMGIPFLKYINKKEHRWCGMLVCPYGPSKHKFMITKNKMQVPNILSTRPSVSVSGSTGDMVVMYTWIRMSTNHSLESIWQDLCKCWLCKGFIPWDGVQSIHKMTQD